MSEPAKKKKPNGKRGGVARGLPQGKPAAKRSLSINGLTPRQHLFLEAFKKCCNLKRAARVIGTTTEAHYAALRENEHYRKAYEAAKIVAFEVIHEKIWELGVEGAVRKKFDARGNPIMDPETGTQYIEREHDTKLLLKLAEVHGDSRWTPTQRLAVTNIEQLSDDELDAEIARAEAASTQAGEAPALESGDVA